MGLITRPERTFRSIIGLAMLLAILTLLGSVGAVRRVASNHSVSIHSRKPNEAGMGLARLGGGGA
jgi:hypothetical protein